MDESSIESKELKPLAHEMSAIASITNRPSLSAYLGTTLNSEVDGSTTNSDHVFGVWINQGFEDAEHNFPHSCRVVWVCRIATRTSTHRPRWWSCVLSIWRTLQLS